MLEMTFLGVPVRYQPPAGEAGDVDVQLQTDYLQSHILLTLLAAVGCLKISIQSQNAFENLQFNTDDHCWKVD